MRSGQGGPVSRDEFTPGDMMKPGVLNIFDAFTLRKQLEGEYQRQEGWVFKADTPAQLAEQLKIPVEMLQKTISEYNEDCEKGHDRLFGKPAVALIPLNKGPIYALKFRPILIDTVGPIIINEEMEALDKNHRPIPGLYAAGVVTSGSQGKDYILHGAALGFSLFSGRFAGKNIASYVKGDA